MPNEHDRHIEGRRVVRLQSFDYTNPGPYFVTICTLGKRCLFGRVLGDRMALNPAGRMVFRAWRELELLHPGIRLDVSVVMPNHLHGALTLPGDPESPIALPDLIGRFKSWTTHDYRRRVRTDGWPPLSPTLWQRGYWERVLRDERELDKAREYMQDNARTWAADRHGAH